MSEIGVESLDRNQTDMYGTHIVPDRQTDRCSRNHSTGNMANDPLEPWQVERIALLCTVSQVSAH